MTDAPDPKKRRGIMTLANKITIGRIMLIPVNVILLLKQHTVAACVLIGVSALSDLLDGVAARVRGEQTALGAFLDPLADKLLLTSVYLTLTILGVIDIWVFVVIFSRDLLIVLGWGVIYILTSSTKIVPRMLGKITTAVQMLVALAFILPIHRAIPNTLVWLVVLFSIASMVDYVVIGEKRLGEWG